MANTTEKKRSLLKTIFPWVGWIGLFLCIGLFTITSCSQNTTMNQQSITYHKANKAALANAATLSEADAELAIERFSAFLKGIGSAEFIEKEINNVYAENAYLNDTLKTLNNREEIKQHFLKTSKAMSDYSVVIDDIAPSKQGYYIRWTMKFNAPKLAKGKEIESIGISHVIFDKDGKALLHQDFWDSTSGFFEHAPVIGSGIRLIKKRL